MATFKCILVVWSKTEPKCNRQNLPCLFFQHYMEHVKIMHHLCIIVISSNLLRSYCCPHLLLSHKAQAQLPASCSNTTISISKTEKKMCVWELEKDRESKAQMWRMDMLYCTWCLIDVRGQSKVLTIQTENCTYKMQYCLVLLPT